MTDVFISDLHLSEDQPGITEGFLAFLENGINDADNLYILGDFFEVWLGDDHETAFSQRIIDALSAVKLPIYLMHGNRDFLMGEAFCQAIGATLLPDPSIIKVGTQSVLLMHGDSLCTEDEQYMQVRGLLRSEAFQQDFLTKSIEERFAFAQGARQESQAHTQESASEIMDVTPSEVIRVMEQSGVSTMIHGHTHRPNCHEVKLSDGLGQRFVLGDWGENGWQIKADENGFELSSFKLSAL